LILVQSVPILYLLFGGVRMTNTAKQGVFTTVLKNGCTNFYIKYSLNNKAKHYEEVFAKILIEKINI